MPTKKEIAETFILTKLGGQIADNKIKPNDIYVYMDMVYNEIIGLEIDKNGAESSTLSASARTFEKDELLYYYDEGRDESFLVVPTDYNEASLIEVRPIKGPAMVMQRNGAQSIYNELESGTTENGIAYLEGDRIYLKDSGKIDCCAYLVKVIPSATTFDESETFPIPHGYGTIFTSRLLDMIEGNRAYLAKKTNDQNENTK